MPLTQSELLNSDVKELRRVLDTHPEFARPLADFTDVNRHGHYVIVADLVWQIWYLAMGTNVLLREELGLPLVAVQRMLFEAMVTLGYLMRHQASQDEALMLLAYSHLKEIKTFPSQPAVTEERRALLSRMPTHLVEEARRRLAKGRSWSGKSIKKMAEESGVLGYAETYGFLSAVAHIEMVGHHVRVTRGEDGLAHIEMGQSISDAEAEAHANFARRALHFAFRAMWGLFQGPSIQLRSEDPEKWLGLATNT
ncbi:MAG: DUF5677 domain-containing protein [Gemmatimonadota bacterium]|nr:DUF5677 domain-containing protein [Gemmatimonadota bacterium]